MKRIAPFVLVCVLMSIIVAACAGPSLAEKHIGQGNANSNAGNFEEAISYLEKALELGLEPSLEQEVKGLLDELRR